MNYIDGQKIMIGDRVSLGGGMDGVVVCSFDDNQFSSDFPESDWGGFLNTGVLVNSRQAGSIHYPVPDIDLVLIERNKII
ncbi:MAG: hypothetical protein V4525_04805 [Pseudomonadota bacterium]